MRGPSKPIRLLIEDRIRFVILRPTDRRANREVFAKSDQNGGGVGAKRQDGKGSIYRRKDGPGWAGKVSLGVDSRGKRVRKSVYGKTQQEVRDQIAALRKQFRRVQSHSA